MDLGIQGKWALVCAASKGLGKGCAQALAGEGVERGHHGARRRGAARPPRPSCARSTRRCRCVAVAGDITTPEGRAAALAACPQVDILVNNAGGPPPGDFRDWDREAWIKALDANMLTPIELIKATIDGMAGRGFGRIVNITSGAVKAPIDILGLSNGARTGLTGFVAGLARQSRVASRNVTINNLLPGPFDTDRLRGTMSRRRAEERPDRCDAVLDARRKLNPTQRFGTTEEFGAACAFLCSVHAGYITGQNLLHRRRRLPGHVLSRARARRRDGDAADDEHEGHAVVRLRRLAQHQRRQHGREQRREVVEEGRQRRPAFGHAQAPAAVGQHRRAQRHVQQRAPARPGSTGWVPHRPVVRRPLNRPAATRPNSVCTSRKPAQSQPSSAVGRSLPRMCAGGRTSSQL